MNILAKNGPATGENSYTYIALYNDDINLQLYGSDADTVEGAVYDTATNTLTLTNYNHPELWLETNMMGDDFKLRLTGENHLASVSIWGAGWGGSLEITGDGSLTINENKTRKYAIYFGAEGTQGALKIGDNVTLTAYKGESYVVAIAGTKSTTFPVSGNFEEALTLTDDSGIEGEIWKFDNVIKEDSYDRTLQVATKAGDDKLYGIYMYKDDDGDGEQNQKTSVYELIKVDGLASGNEYVAALIDSAKVYAWPEGYTADANGATVTARECTMESMEEIKKDNETFYWGGDEVVYGESGWGESKYSVYQAVLDEVTMKHWTGEMRTGKLVVQTEQRNLTFNKDEIPTGYEKNIVKTGLYNFYATNEVVKVTPKPVETNPGTDSTEKPADEGTDNKEPVDEGTNNAGTANEEAAVKDLPDSDTGVSISLTNGVPEGAVLEVNTLAPATVLESKPELTEELPGLLAVYQISVVNNGESMKIKDNMMEVKIPVNDSLKGYKYYQVVYLGDELERFHAVLEGESIVFKTSHLSDYAVLGADTPFATDIAAQPTDTTPTETKPDTGTTTTDTNAANTNTGTSNTNTGTSNTNTGAASTDAGTTSPKTGDAGILAQNAGVLY